MKKKAARKIIGWITVRGKRFPKFEKSKRQLLKEKGTKKATGRTSLREKRIKAINDVASVKRKQNKSWEFDRNPMGSGSDMDVYLGGSGKNVVKIPLGQSKFHRDSLLERFGAIVQLRQGKKKIAPESFLVNTENSSYLVQQKVKPMPELGDVFFEHGQEVGQARIAKHRKYKEYIENEGARKGVEMNDVVSSNMGVLKGKPVSIDSGENFGKDLDHFSPKHKKKLIKKLNQFAIGKRKKK